MRNVRCAVTSVGGGAQGEHCIAALQELIPFVGGRLLQQTVGIGYTREEVTSSILDFTEDRMARLKSQEQAFLHFLDEK